MKIKSLEIYGYGRLEHRKFDFNQDFVQIYGENESGKSTMQAFIHALLFGFPKDGEYEPRLEPRFAPQYGGKMLLSLNTGEEVSIERIYVHQKEETTILLDGKTKDITWLNQLLNHISKETYKNIFSFDVLGLQEVHRKLTEDKLQAYLLQAGAFGSTEFTQMTEHIKQEKERLLSENSTGEINRATENLQEIESLIRQKDIQFETYDLLLNEQDKLLRESAEFDTHIKELNNVLNRKKREIKYHEKTKEWKKLEHKLNVTPPTFPEQGIDRYESLKKQKHQVNRDLQLRLERLTQLTNENQNIKLLESNVIDQTNEILKQEQSYRNYQSELSHHTTLLEQLQKEQQGLMRDIGWSEYQSIDVNPLLKEKASLAINQLEKNMLEKAQIEREINFVKDTVAKKEQAVHDLAQIKVHDERFDKAEQLEKNKSLLLDKTKLYEKMKQEAVAFETGEMKKYKLHQTCLILMMLLFLGGAVYSYFINQFIMLAIFCVLAILTGIMIFMNKKPKVQFNQSLQQDVDDLSFKVKDLQDNFDLSFDLEEQRQVRLRMFDRNNEVVREKNRYAALSQELDAINELIKASTEELEHIKEKLALPNSFLVSRVSLAIKQIGKINDLDREIKLLSTKQQDINAYLKRFNTEVNALNKAVPINLDINTLFHDLKTLQTKDEKNKFQFAKNNDQIMLLNKEMNIMHDTLNQINTELLALFKEAQVENESEYYHREREFVTYQNDLAQFDTVGRILEEQGFSYEDNTDLSFVTAIDLIAQQNAIEDHIDQITYNLSSVTEKLSDIKQQLETIANDDSLSKLKYEFQIKKNQLNDLIKDFTSVNYIETLVDAHIEGVKEKRLPYVIQDATEIFKYLTEDRYMNVLYKDNQLVVKATDGQIYHPTELSQSTKEILYIALRLSLIQSLNKYYPFPIIIDDAFVHFDRTRRERILEYMMKLKSNQIIYYTCNRSTVVTNKNTITLERINKEVKK
ncbi:ATP-binding protein [Macrococcus animalis]|uniref:ATP-binding protein n=1 Tax=Macrococcus animalis TaxID=3395467 RepID=UPI0039BE0DE3